MASYGHLYDWGRSWTKLDGSVDQDNDEITLVFVKEDRFNKDEFRVSFSPKEVDQLMGLLENCKEALDDPE